MSLLHRCLYNSMPRGWVQPGADDGGRACGRRDAGRHHAGAFGSDAEPAAENGALSNAAIQLKVVAEKSKYDFEAVLRRRGIDLPPLAVDTLQVNVSKIC